MNVPDQVPHALVVVGLNGGAAVVCIVDGDGGDAAVRQLPNLRLLIGLVGDEYAVTVAVAGVFRVPDGTPAQAAGDEEDVVSQLLRLPLEAVEEAGEKLVGQPGIGVVPEEVNWSIRRKCG